MEILPAVTPTNVYVDVVDGQEVDKATGAARTVKMVLVVVEQPTGRTYAFFDAKAAQSIGANIEQAGRKADRDKPLHIARQIMVPRNGDGH